MEFKCDLRMNALEVLFPEIAKVPRKFSVRMFRMFYDKAVMYRYKRRDKVFNGFVEIPKYGYEPFIEMLGEDRCKELGLTLLLSGSGFPIVVDKRKVPPEIAEVLGSDDYCVYLWIG